MFFVLKDAKVGTPQDRDEGTNATVANEPGGDYPKCPLCGRALGMYEWVPPLRMELETWGKHYGDFIDPVGSHDVLLSERFVQLFQEHQLSGLTGFEPVEAIKVVHRRGKPKEERPQYFRARVVRSETTVDQEASGMQFAPNMDEAIRQKGKQWGLSELKCPVCLNRHGQYVRRTGLIIKQETWTGEDIFRPRGDAEVVVSERFKEVCESGRIRNVRFIRAEECDHDLLPSESKRLLKWLRMVEDLTLSKSLRRGAYRALAHAAGKPIDSAKLVDPDTDMDRTVIDWVKKRLIAEGVLQQRGRKRGQA